MFTWDLEPILIDGTIPITLQSDLVNSTTKSLAISDVTLTSFPSWRRKKTMFLGIDGYRHRITIKDDRQVIPVFLS